MSRLFAAVFAAMFALGSLASFAADAPKKDEMKKDEMKKDAKKDDKKAADKK